MHQEITLQQLREEGYYLAITLDEEDIMRVYYIQDNWYEFEFLDKYLNIIKYQSNFNKEQVIYYE